jgi:short-subunit dehydrogenase
MVMTIRDAVIIVTGASRGIGAATARALAAEGARVVLVARTQSALQELEQELPGSLAIEADLTKPEEIARVVETAYQKFGQINGLVNNAGIGIYGPLEQIDLIQYQQVMDINVYAPVRMMQAVIPIMRAQRGGSIVNVSSTVSHETYPTLSAYAASKASLNSLTLTARQELQKDGIAVTVVYPGLVATEFGKHILTPEGGPEWGWDGNPRGDKPEKVAQKIVEALRSGKAEVYM